MRRCVQALVVAAVLFTGRTAFADSIAVGDTIHLLNGGGAIFGGVFEVDDLATAAPLDLLTFCVQHDEDINPWDFFTVGSISTSTDDVPPDPLDNRTAWIYTMFRQGALSGYTEDEIQAAIWVIEDESYFTNNIFPALALSLQTNANTLIAAAQDAVDVGGWVNGDVRVMNLFFEDGSKAQDLLLLREGVRIQSEAPEPATLLLVGSGIAAVVRRRAKNRNR